MAGNGRGGPKAGTKAKKKQYKKTVLNVKRRAKDLDQIQDEIRAVAEGKRALTSYLDEDAPGGGAFFCVECSRHCVSGAALALHRATKSHKRQLKTVAETQYTQAEADQAAGMTR